AARAGAHKGRLRRRVCAASTRRRIDKATPPTVQQGTAVHAFTHHLVASTRRASDLRARKVGKGARERSTIESLSVAPLPTLRVLFQIALHLGQQFARAERL